MRVSFRQVILASLGIFCLSSSARAVTYNVTDLGAGVSPSAINASGEIVGSQLVGTSGMHAFSYSNGHVVDLGTLPGDLSSIAFGINTSGQIVGKSSDMVTHSEAFRYQGGSMTGLGTLPGDTASSAAAVNDSGIIVGTSSHTVTNGSVIHAFRYDGTMHDLGSLGGPTAFAIAVNNSGLIVGQADPAGDATGLNAHAVIFGATITDLNQPLWSQSGALGVNGQGQIVGFFVPGDGHQHPFLRTVDGVIHDLGFPAGFDRAYANAVNNLGDAVGFAEPGLNASGDHAVLFSGGQALDLNNFIPANSGWVLQSAGGINDAGEIIGQGELNGVPHGFLLAIPEPGAGALLLCVVPAVLRRRRTM